jgi:zinc and cadmium transporter
MTLMWIVLATLLAGMGSVWVAAWVARVLFTRYTQHLLSLAAGALLATAFTNLLPEAFEMAQQEQMSLHVMFVVLLVGVVFFFLLDKAQLWHHGHEHGGHDHAHSHSHSHGQHPHHGAHAHSEAQSDGQGGGWAVLLGDSVHAFGDGILIAAAFMADTQLGWAAALAVLTHEIPHHVGDLVVLRQSLDRPAGAVFKLSLTGAVTAVGGVAGFLLVGALQHELAYFLLIAASSFIYVALADLIPQLQKRLSFGQTAAQVGWLFTGMLVVMFVGAVVQH